MTRQEIRKHVIGSLALSKLAGGTDLDRLEDYVTLCAGLYWRGHGDGLEEAALEVEHVGDAATVHQCYENYAAAIRNLKTIARKL